MAYPFYILSYTSHQLKYPHTCIFRFDGYSDLSQKEILIQDIKAAVLKDGTSLIIQRNMALHTK